MPAIGSDDPLDDLPHHRAHGDPELAVQAAALYDALTALPVPLRDVVAAVDLAGLSYAEAATALGVPRGTVMSRLFRARLAGAIGGDDPERTLPA